MAAQGERVSEAIDAICSSVLDPMAQDEEVEQEMLVVEEQEQFFPPQMDSEPEMGAAAAYDTSPPPLHQNHPILAKSAQLSAPDMAQLMAMLVGMRGETRQMKNEMDGNAQQMKKRMEGMENNMERKMDGMANNAGGDAVHGCGPTGGTRTNKGGNGKGQEGGKRI